MDIKKSVNYVAPEAEIILSETRNVICGSGSTQQYQKGNADSWF